MKDTKYSEGGITVALNGPSIRELLLRAADEVSTVEQHGYHVSSVILIGSELQELSSEALPPPHQLVIYGLAEPIRLPRVSLFTMPNAAVNGFCVHPRLGGEFASCPDCGMHWRNL